MSQTARCKFRLAAAEDVNGEIQITLETQYDPNDPDDTKFSKYTPWGTLKTAISNPNVIPMFKDQVGKEFYVDIVPVE